MKVIISLFVCILLFLNSIIAQNPGDTIKVKTFHYGSNNRDTVANFPSGNLTYEKIIMAYNMRCKNGLVSTGDNRNLGCGEWDYSCNTYIADSSKVELVLSTQANYVISNFTGNVFPYTSKPVYDYYRYSFQKLKLDSISVDSQFAINTGTASLVNGLNTNQNSGKSQFLYLASELSNSGLSAGLLQSILLKVKNAGGKASFFKVRIKHTTASQLMPGMADTSAFTEVYLGDYVFVNGENRILFNTTFSWNGSENLLVEFSFTNSAKGSNPIILEAKSESNIMGIYANNNYAVDLSNNGHVIIDTNLFYTINNEITIAFWAFGDASKMPQTNSILYGTDNNINNRQLNIHLPHSSNNVYFDCGFAAGGYDRINKIATSQEQGGQWNHWTFTKNASSGTMKIFLNGQLWLSGTAKTKAIKIMRLVLGKDINLNSNFKGKVNKLAIWNKELPDSFIVAVMNQAIETLTPFATNLISYYPMSEGSGKNIIEFNSQKISQGTNLNWSFERGENLIRNFYGLDIRPSISFTRGIYYTTPQTAMSTDSVQRITNIIQNYSITSKAGVTPMQNDIVNLVSTTDSLFLASNSYVYDGNSGAKTPIDSITNAAEGSYTISNLNYFRRFPWFNEIMSFVTPYGIGLNLGMNGRTWYFDVTDFAPILKDKKRILMTLGGQNQEQNDVEFWFIVGTPVRNVIDFNQVYQGAPRGGNAPLTQINSGARFPMVKALAAANATSFKFRSIITGHGAEGEFEANGGQVEHYLNFNNNAKKLNWVISKECAFNPIFPQGGTWVYDRQGWCPGESSLVKEWDITDVVKAGDSISIDYDASNPPNASGSYNYIVAHQLVSYGNLNHNLDARIIEIVHPTDNVLYARKNPYCSQPKVVVQNSGKQTIQNIQFSYWINNAEKQSFTWYGNLASLQTDTITLPIQALYNSGMQTTGNRFNVNLVQTNNKADDYALNNTYSTGFVRPEIIPSVFTLEFRTNNRATENGYKLYDAWDNLIDSKDFTEANTTFTKAYNLGGCYKLVVTDSGHDGVQWWANSGQGTGFIRLKRANNQILKTFQPDFGGGFEYYFTTNWALGKEELSLDNTVLVYPNPAKDILVISGINLENAKVSLVNMMGQTLLETHFTHSNDLQIPMLDMPEGIYLVVVSNGDESVVRKIVKQ
jgi:hypothetical protein